VNFVVERDPPGTMTLRTMPIPPMPEELKQIVEENK